MGRSVPASCARSVVIVSVGVGVGRLRLDTVKLRTHDVCDIAGDALRVPGAGEISDKHLCTRVRLRRRAADGVHIRKALQEFEIAVYHVRHLPAGRGLHRRKRDGVRQEALHPRPANSINGPVTCTVFNAVGVCVFAAEDKGPGAAPEHHGKLLLCGRIGRTEPAVTVAADNAVLRRPQYGVGIPFSGLRVREGILPTHGGLVRQPVQHRGKLRTGEDAVRVEAVVSHAVHDAFFPQRRDCFCVPFGTAHIGIAVINRARGCSEGKQHHDAENN